MSAKQLLAKMQEMKKLQAEFFAKVKANAESIKTTGEGKEELLEEIAEIHKKLSGLQGVVAGLEVGGSGAARPEGRRKSRKSIGRQFSETDSYKSWKKQKTKGLKDAPFAVQLKSSLFRKKTLPEDYIGEENAGTLIVPMYRDGIVEIPLPMPVIRSLVTVLPAPDTNLVKVDREVIDLKIATKLTADVAIGQQVFPVENVSGFGTNMPFNTFKLDNTVLTETLLIASIDVDASTVTTTAVSTIAMLTGHICSGSAYTATDEGAVVPNSFIKFEDYDVPIVDLYSSTSVTKDKLNDVNLLENFINTRGLKKTALMEDKNFFYAPGGSSKIMTGIWYDSDITELTWSTQPAGTTIFEFIVEAMVTIMENDYEPNALTVTPRVWQQLIVSKASDGHYLYLPSLSEEAPSQVLIIPLRVANTLLPTHGVMADWAGSMTIYDAEQSDIEIGTNNDDLSRRKRTMVFGERVGFGIESPLGVIRMIFDAPPAAA